MKWLNNGKRNRDLKRWNKMDAELWKRAKKYLKEKHPDLTAITSTETLIGLLLTDEGY